MVKPFNPAFSENPLEETGYQIVHAIAGRIRIRISWLETDADSVSKLQRLLESFSFVTNVRVNPVAQSIVITYRASAISSQAAVEQFVEAMQQVKPTPVTTTQPSQPTGEPIVEMAQTLVQTVSQTIQAVAQTASQAVQHPTPPTPPQEPPSSTVETEMPSPWDITDDSDPDLEVTPPASPIVPEPEISASPPVRPELWLHSTASLSKRLNVTSQAITRRRSQSDFSTWTQKQDPEGVAWIYDASSQSFCPFTPFASPLEPEIAESLTPPAAAPTP